MIVPDISYFGFQPSEKFSNILFRDLWRLFDYCPSDASLSATVVKEVKRFSIVVSVVSSNGKMVAKAHGKSLHKLKEDVLNQIYRQLLSWRDHRFSPLELSVSEEQPLTSVTAIQLKPLTTRPRILVVDDDPMCTLLVKKCFLTLGCEVRSVNSGQDAVEEIVSEEYDLVVLDWIMPDMNGDEVLINVQNRNSENQSIDYQWSSLKMPVVTYSGNSKRNIVRPDCKHFRFIDHWDKSMSPSLLSTKTSQTLAQIGLEIARARSIL